MIPRRTFVAGLGATAAWPLAARGQQSGLPVIGWLGAASAATMLTNLVGFRRGLDDTGYVEGRNVVIEYRWAEGQSGRYAALAADLLRRQPAVLVTFSNAATLAVKAATSRVPTVFSMGGDPIRLGLVASLNRPGGNFTGVTLLNDVLIKKRLALMHELVPNAAVIAVLINSSNPDSETRVADVQAAARALGQKIEILTASTATEIDAAFAALGVRHAGAILIQNDPFFADQRRQQIMTLAISHGVPAGFESRDIAEAGGLVSYGADRTDLYRQVGVYVGRILKGEKPAALPVQQPTKFELVVNLTTAKALGLTVPPNLLATADEVIE